MLTLDCRPESVFATSVSERFPTMLALPLNVNGIVPCHRPGPEGGIDTETPPYDIVKFDTLALVRATIVTALPKLIVVGVNCA